MARCGVAGVAPSPSYFRPPASWASARSGDDFGDYPGLRLDANGLDVLGEVYEVEPATLRTIDEIEGHFPGEATVCHYFRRSHPILMQDETRLTADLYECTPRLYDCSRPLEVGDWIAWKQRAAAANG